MLTATTALISLAAFAALPQEPQATDAAHTEAPAHLVLMVGITDYPEIDEYIEFPPLTGCLNDIELLRSTLVDRFDFADNDEVFRVLINEDATHKNVVLAIYDLIQDAGPETEVLIYFSGHGSRLPDTSGRAAVELDGMDSTFVVVDGRLPELESPFDLTDDELFSLVQALCEVTPLVTLITDCCHSGGVVRGNPKQVPRLAPEGILPFDPKMIVPFWPEGIPFLDDGDLRRKQGLPFVHLAACASDESARELQFEEADRTYGALTYFLTEELRQLEPGTTFAQLASKLRVRVASEVWDQSVQLEGEIDRVIFGGGFTAPLPGFGATAEIREDGYIEIEAGGLHLLNEDTEFQIQTLHGKPLGIAKMWEMDALESTAQWQGAPDPEWIEDEDAESMAVRAIPKQAWQTETVQICFGDGEREGELLKRLQPEVEKEFELVTEVTPASACEMTWNEAADPPAWQLTSYSDGALLWYSDQPADQLELDGLLAALKREQLFRSLMELSRASGGIGLQMDLKPASDETLSGLRSAWPGAKFAAAVARDLPAGLSNATAAFARLLDREGSDLSDVAEIYVDYADEKRSMGAYISVLCLSSDRTISTIYPTNRSRQNYLEPGQPLTIPIEVFFNPGADPKLGVRDRYFAVATATWVDFSIFERNLPIHRAAEQSQERVKRSGPSNRMPPIMEHALNGSTLRGPSLSADSWSFGITALDVQIFRPEN